MKELHTDSIDGGHEGQLWARSRARERAYSNNKKVGKFSNDNKVKDKETYLCGLKVSKDYINIMNIAICCDLKVTMIFMRNML